MLALILAAALTSCPTLPNDDYEINRLLGEDRLVCLFDQWWYIDENKKAWKFSIEEDVL